MSKPKKLEIVWSFAAMEDFEKIIRYYVETDSAFANKLHHELYALSQTLATFSERGRVVPELQLEGVNKYRELIHHPFRLMYVASKADVVVTALFDSRRDLEELIFERMKTI